ncbi:hypothetical protein HOO54_20130 [Bacillus sp. WMMC1349]|nr:hypothetical protein [Bacillus sp. WMMC1349]NPC94469.1 hypothetical protein [Bacillus sp. WMMC1349]
MIILALSKTNGPFKNSSQLKEKEYNILKNYWEEYGEAARGKKSSKYKT